MAQAATKALTLQAPGGPPQQLTARTTDLQRLASSEEVARATLFLASDLASAVTGQMLTVDCGEFHS